MSPSYTLNTCANNQCYHSCYHYFLRPAFNWVSLFRTSYTYTIIYTTTHYYPELFCITALSTGVKNVRRFWTDQLGGRYGSQCAVGSSYFAFKRSSFSFSVQLSNSDLAKVAVLVVRSGQTASSKVSDLAWTNTDYVVTDYVTHWLRWTQAGLCIHNVSLYQLKPTLTYTMKKNNDSLKSRYWSDFSPEGVILNPQFGHIRRTPI